MLHTGGFRAHGGQGATAGAIQLAAPVRAVLRPTYERIRIWHDHGEAQDFTYAEARELATKADTALVHRADDDWAGLWLDDGGVVRPLIVDRQWLLSFVGALRRALRALDAALAMGKPLPNAEMARVEAPDTMIAEPLQYRVGALTGALPARSDMIGALRSAREAGAGEAEICMIAGIAFTAAEVDQIERDLTGDSPRETGTVTIDDASEPGSWAQHILHTAAMRGGVADSS